jgi:hypothetical protein
MRSRRTLGLILALFSTALVATAVTGCGTEASPRASGEKMPPLVDQFKSARERATSDWEREVWDRSIKSGKVDPADYEEAFSRYRRCAEDTGYRETYTKQSNGLYKIMPPAELAGDQKTFDIYAAATEKCADSSGLMRIEALYGEQINNPDLLANPKLLVVQCLKKAGLVPADYTPEKLDAFIKNRFAGPDFDPMNEEAQKCFAAGGMAVNVPPGQSPGGERNPNPVESGN